MNTQSPIVSCQGLSKQFGGVRALDSIYLDLPRGQIIGLLGPNGSGKTTLIKLLNGLLSPTEGAIYVNGMEPGPETKSIVSYLPERTYLNDWMRIRDIIRYFKDFYADFDENRAYKMLMDLGLTPDARLKTLSKGNREKVQLVLVMSRRAALYVLDEPIGGVDPAARDYILNTIISNYEPNATVLLSTHLIYDIESVLDYIVFLQNGRIRLTGAVDDLRSQYGKSIDQLFREVFRC